jgi:hypothetical protein
MNYSDVMSQYLWQMCLPVMHANRKASISILPCSRGWPNVRDKTNSLVSQAHNTTPRACMLPQQGLQQPWCAVPIGRRTSDHRQQRSPLMLWVVWWPPLAAVHGDVPLAAKNVAGYAPGCWTHSLAPGCWGPLDDGSWRCDRRLFQTHPGSC